ncbi:hypothetical protein Droror1_Dr00015070 [Drosera rotundifolia]
MGTGKTSLVLRFVKGQFFDHQEPTIGAAFFSQILSLNEATIKFDIWDTAGQERYHSLAPIYYRGAAAAVVVYDIANMERQEILEEQIEALLNVEKQMRLAGDVGMRKATCDILQLCFEAKAWKTLNDQIMLLSKRRGQLKQVIQVIWDLCHKFCFLVYIYRYFSGNLVNRQRL